MSVANRVRHHVVIGGGIAGSQAAATLRAREPDSRVTMLTLSSLLCYNRYDLPRVFRGARDWREFLVQPPGYYEAQRITVRRNTRVANVDGARHAITLDHKEQIAFDTLLVASGGRGYIPEELADYAPLMHPFASFTEAVRVAEALPEGGHLIMLGGDMIGLDLTRTLLSTGYRVTLIAESHTFWPHEVSDEERPRFHEALARIGIQVIDAVAAGGITAVEQGAKGLSPRRVILRDGSDVYGDVVMPSFGLTPSVEFMLGSGVDIERGLLVAPTLRTTGAGIYAAGDVCQIWSEEDNRYRFYYGWKNVRAMGELAARNMTGGDEAWAPAQNEKLGCTPEGAIFSPFWEYH